MATAYVSYGTAGSPAGPGFASAGIGSLVYGPFSASEALAIVAATNTPGAIVGSAARRVARVRVDADCWVAVGTAPDPTALVANALVTGARFAMLAGDWIDVLLAPGQKITVRGF